MLEQQLLVVLVPGELKDDVIDMLIACDDISGFNMATTAGFSKEHSQYNLREQVEGFREMFQFEVLHMAPQEQNLLDQLRQVCTAVQVRYWIAPLRSAGHL